MTIFVLGGGASGMAAALASAASGRHRVFLLERQPRLGRKLLATGNGRCNLSNLHLDAARYHGRRPEFCLPALAAFGVGATRNFFSDLGLLTVAEPSGRVYPYTDQANSVLDVLRFALDRPNLEVRTGCAVTRLCRKPSGILVRTGSGDYPADRVIVACGGMASARLGGTDWGYRLLEDLGHRRSPLFPSLVPLLTEQGDIGGLRGVRTEAAVRLLDRDVPLAESRGEVQFTETGVSGPAVFEISRAASAGHPGTEIRLDLLPDLPPEEVLSRLLTRCRSLPARPAGDILTGMLHSQLGRAVVKAAGLAPSAPLGALTGREIRAVAGKAKRWSLVYKKTRGMDAAQVTAGGILTGDFVAETMESRLIPGVYACGEVLDIDGDCGGYNLQWAWSSGLLAGRSAAREDRP